MPIYKRCPRCHKRIESGNVCSCIKNRHREYDRYSRDQKSKKYYNSSEWRGSRDAALEKDGEIDVYLFMTEGRIVVADTAHHIIPLRDDWSKRNDIDNLISLHHDTHSLIEQMYRKDKEKAQRTLQKMLREYRTKG